MFISDKMTTNVATLNQPNQNANSRVVRAAMVYHSRRGARHGASSDRETERTIAIITNLCELTLQAGRYRKLYNYIVDDLTGLTGAVGYVRMEYSLKLFWAALEKEPVTALLAYNFIRRLEVSVGYKIPDDVCQKGERLYKGFVSALARYARSGSDPRDTLSALGLDSPDKLGRLAPFLRRKGSGE